MGIGFGEVVLILLVLPVIGYAFVLPFVGIAWARRRMKEHRRSVGAVVWPSINMGLSGLGIAHGLASAGHPLRPLAVFVLNLIWLWVSVTANRSAARHAALARPS